MINPFELLRIVCSLSSRLEADVLFRGVEERVSVYNLSELSVSSRDERQHCVQLDASHSPDRVGVEYPGYIWSLVVNEDSLPGEAAAKMQTCAMKGRVIVVNVTKIRSNAIIVSQTQGFAIASPMGIRKSPRSHSVQLN